LGFQENVEALVEDGYAGPVTIQKHLSEFQSQIVAAASHHANNFAPSFVQLVHLVAGKQYAVLCPARLQRQVQTSRHSSFLEPIRSQKIDFINKKKWMKFEVKFTYWHCEHRRRQFLVEKIFYGANPAAQ